MNGFNQLETFCYAVAAFLVVIGIVVLNDYLIRRSVQRSEKRNRPNRFQNCVNQTSWREILWLVIFVSLGLGLTLFAPRFKDWFGDLRPLIPYVFPVVFFGIMLYVGGQFGWAYWKTRHSRQALRLVEQGDVSGAIELLQEQLRLNGPSGEVLNGLAIIYGHQLDWNRAWETICEAEACDPKNVAVQINKGVILHKLERHQEAVESLQYAQALAPKNVSVACNCGNLLAEMGQIDEARKMLEKAECAFQPLNSAGTFTRKPGLYARKLEQQFLQPLRQRLAETPRNSTTQGLSEQAPEAS